MEIPEINYYKIKNLTTDLIELEWKVSNAHSVEIKGFGNLGFEQKARIPRNKTAWMELELIATNLENNLESKSVLKIAPAPFTEDIHIEYLGKGQCRLESSFKNIQSITIKELDIIINQPYEFSKKSVKGKSVTVLAEGFNKDEIETKVLDIDFKDVIIWKPYIYILFFVFILFLTSIITFKACGSRKVVVQKLAKIEKISVCTPGSDTLVYVKQKIIELLIQSNVLTKQSKYAEFQCINSLLVNADFLIIESTQSGDNYHTLDIFIDKTITDSFKIDTIKIDKRGGQVKFRIYGELVKPISTLAVNTKKTDQSKTISQIPTIFQGKIRGKIKRVNILTQTVNGKIIEITYSVLGSSRDQSKKGKINLETNEVEFETFGKGTLTKTEKSTSLIFEDNQTTIISINY